MPIRFEMMSDKDFEQSDLPMFIKASEAEEKVDVQSILNPVGYYGMPTVEPEVKRSVNSHTRGCIPLAKRIINHVIAGRDAETLSKILGFEHGKQVARFEKFYHRPTGEYISNIDDIEDSKTILCGAEAFGHEISKFDLEYGIKETLMSILFSPSSPMREFTKNYSGEFNQQKNGLLLTADWYFDPSDKNLLDKQEYCINIFADFFKKVPNSRLSFLLNLKNKEILYNMLQKYVIVIPMALRPDVKKLRNPITQSYVKIIRANINLRALQASIIDAYSLVSYYKKLDQTVNDYLYYDKPSIKDPKISMLRSIQGKEHHIRTNMLGKRVDYSARAVITAAPFMSLKNIGIPEKMLLKLYQAHLAKRRHSKDVDSLTGRKDMPKAIHDIASRKYAELGNKTILESVPVLLGRQPTLSKLSLQAFEPVAVKGNTIRVNPLMVEAFNADFDGDQMHATVPIGDEAVREHNDLLKITNNLYYPEDGECQVRPRHEILYGLYKCSSDEIEDMGKRIFVDFETVYNLVLDNKVNVKAKAICGKYTESCGKLAVRHCLFKYQPDIIKQLDKDTVKEVVNGLLMQGKDTFVNGIDRLVKLGFIVAKLYPPSLSIFVKADFNDKLDVFNDKIRFIHERYTDGFELAKNYTKVYSKAYTSLSSEVKDVIKDRVGNKSNGFVELATSGARGSLGNITQLFALKGRIQKNDSESLQVIIDKGHIEGFSSLELFATAFGGRKGYVDKTLSTSEVGYLSRVLWHSTQPYIITSEDCGTSKGLLIRKSDIAEFFHREKDVNDIFTKIITGRFTTDGRGPIKEKEAIDICNNLEQVEMRSPITCDNPCCKKCYGIDLSTHRLVAKNTAVGFIAAHAVGATGLQLTLDSFHKGGVVEGGGPMSNFHRLETFVRLRSIESFSSYDPLAWATGNVEETQEYDGKKNVYIGNSPINRTVPSSAVLKKYVMQGEGICLVKGDYDPRELLKYKGVRDTQLYLLYLLYSIFRSERELSMKHFEIIVSSMEMAVIVATDRSDLKVGRMYDMIQLKSGSLANTIYETTLVGVGDVPLRRPMAMSGVLLERVLDNLSHSILLGLEDALNYPLQRVAFGLTPNNGTSYVNYIEER
ncbi:MAG: hypothetical protein LBS29_05050 [Endomicrobium sp.]|jgi:DNA-directed RNA polymerase subunit beta'|nr:hypothetical protein [Endomicrobium sp.]